MEQHFFFSKARGFLILLLAFLLLLSCTTLLYAKAAFDINTVSSVPDTYVATCPTVGYNVGKSPDGASTVYTPLNEDPQIHIPLSGQQVFNRVTVYLKEEVPADASFQVYYALPGTDLEEKHSSRGIVLDDRKSVLFCLEEGAFSLIRLDVNTAFSLESIELSQATSLGVAHSVSIPALILLVLVLLAIAVLVIFEKKLGCFAYVGQKARLWLESLKDLWQCKKYCHIGAAILAPLAVVALTLSYIVLIMTSHFKESATLYLFSFSLLTVALLILDFALNHRKNGIARTVLLLTLIFGFLFSFSFPMCSLVSWDDEIHYERTLDLKCFLFLNEQTYADQAIYSRYFPYDDTYNSEVDTTTLLVMDETKVASSRESQPLYSYLGYLPGAVGMAVAELLDADFLKSFFFTKIAQVITYAAVLYFALKRLKGGALIFASVCLLPTAMFLVSSFAYDWWVTVFITLGYAFFISEMQNTEKPFSLKTAFFMLLAMVLGCGPKAIYFLLIFPMLFVRKDKFTTSKNCWIYRLMVILAMLIVLASFMTPFLINTGDITDTRGGSDVNSTEQLKFILSDPLGYADILLRFLLSYISFGNAELYTTNYAYIGFLPNYYGTIAIFIMLYAAFTDKSERDGFKGALPIKAISWLTVAGQLALVATALYIAFTPVGHHTVLGCQYRYILPILLPALYALGSTKLVRRGGRNYNEVLIPSLLAVNLFATFYIVYIQALIV